MERISEHLSKDFSIVRLYKDDLEDLEKILKQASEEITWTTENYKFNSLDELLENYKKPIIKELVIDCKSHSSTIELRNFRSSVRVISKEPKDEGIFTQLCKTLDRTEQKSQFLFSFKTYWILTFLYFLVEYFLKFMFKININIAWYGVFFAFLISLPIYGSWIKLRRNTKVKLIFRHEETSFWNRNKDQIILLIIGGVIGAIITSLVNYLAVK